VLVAVAVGVASACSLGFDQDANQCNTMADCKRLFPDFHQCPGLTCNTSTHLCGQNAILCCNSNAECIDRHGGEARVCAPTFGVCPELVSDNCPRLLSEEGAPELRDDNTVVIGALCDSAQGCRGIETAWREIHAQGGLPPRTAGAPRRPLVIIMCDGAVLGSAKGLPRTAALLHLSEDVGVPVVLGETSNALAIPESFLSPVKTLLLGHFGALSGSHIDTVVTYRTSPSDLAHVATIAASISDYFEPSLREPGGPLASGKPLKVLALVRDDATTGPAAQILSDKLRFNGTTAVGNGENFKVITYPTFKDPFMDGAPTTLSLIDAVVSAKPHVIVFEGQSEIYTALLRGIDQAWSETSYRPRMLIGGSLGKARLLLDAIASNDDLRRRTFGFTAGLVEQDTPGFVAFRESFRSSFAGATPDAIAAEGYDATWMAFYAIALGGRAPSPALWPTALPEITPFVPMLLPAPGRPTVMVGPGGLASGLALLDSGLDLVGASGPLDIDLATGTADQDVDMWYCTADATGAANGFASTGYHYSATQKRFVGSVVVR
jgi:hypothetical protein